MSRPTTTTPTVTLVRVLRALPAWKSRHAEALADELSDRPTGTDEPETLASDLETSEEVLLRERREDKHIFTRRATFLTATQSWIRATRASLTRRLDTHAMIDRILADFGFTRPSDITTTDDANRALTRMAAAFNTHAAILAPLTTRLPAWQQRLAELQTERQSLDDDLTRETHETATAHDHRDLLRARGLALIRDLDLAARALEHTSTPHDELRALYNAT